LTHRLRDYNQLASRPGVRLFADEGRSWFARSNEHFDVIQMSMVDTWAATGAGAFSLSENGLYTVEGWRTFFQHLTPSGVFTVSRWYSPNNIDETGRMMSVAVAALLDEGVSEPSDHLFLASTDNLATLNRVARALHSGRTWKPDRDYRQTQIHPRRPSTGSRRQPGT
jgi:spermidine synthase